MITFKQFVQEDEFGDLPLQMALRKELHLSQKSAETLLKWLRDRDDVSEKDEIDCYRFLEHHYQKPLSTALSTFPQHARAHQTVTLVRKWMEDTLLDGYGLSLHTKPEIA